MFKYSINLLWSEEDDCYVATVSEFPGLSAFGESPEEAIKEAKIAVDGFLRVFKEDGCLIPKPNTLKPFSGQTRLRLPKSLHATLNQEAQKDGVSLNTYIISLLSERHVAKQLEKELTELKNIVLSSILLTGGHGIQAKSDGHTFKLNDDMKWPEAAVNPKILGNS